MSLRVFHLVFITLSTILAWFFGGWCFWTHSQSPSHLLLALGTGSFLAGAALIAYERWFLRKISGTRFP